MEGFTIAEELYAHNSNFELITPNFCVNAQLGADEIDTGRAIAKARFQSLHLHSRSLSPHLIFPRLQDSR